VPEPRPADYIKARSDAEAKQRYLRFLQASLSAVHPNAQWKVLPRKTDGQWSAVTVPDWLSLETPGGPEEQVYLRATQVYEYIDHAERSGERKVATRDYAYTLADGEERRNEIFSWQWHPTTGKEDPHLHAHRGRSGTLGKLHLPTGRIAFEDVLLFLVDDWGLTPCQDDGEQTLRESRSRFHAFRTWT